MKIIGGSKSTGAFLLLLLLVIILVISSAPTHQQPRYQHPQVRHQQIQQPQVQYPQVQQSQVQQSQVQQSQVQEQQQMHASDSLSHADWSAEVLKQSDQLFIDDDGNLYDSSGNKIVIKYVRNSNVMDPDFQTVYPDNILTDGSNNPNDPDINNDSPSVYSDKITVLTGSVNMGGDTQYYAKQVMSNHLLPRHHSPQLLITAKKYYY